MGIIVEHHLSKKFDNKKLSVIFDSDSFFYSVSDFGFNLYTAVKHVFDSADAISALDEIITKENLSNREFSKVNIFSKNKHFTFIPKTELDVSNLIPFTGNAYSSYNGDTQLDIYKPSELAIIHEYPPQFGKVLEKLTPNPLIRHLSQAWLSLCQTDGMYLYMNMTDISIHIVKNGRFVFHNIFNISNQDDAFYFAMLGFQEFSLNVDVDYIFLDGCHPEKSDLGEMLSNYISNISSIQRGFNNIETSSDILDLYAVSLCE